MHRMTMTDSPRGIGGWIQTAGIVMALATCGCETSKEMAMNQTEDEKPKELVVETDEGAVIGQVSEVDEFPQKVVRVSSAESQQFAAWSNVASDFRTAYGQPQSENELKQYDEAFKAWQRSTEKRHSDQEVINLLGAYLGQRMVSELDMEWVVVTDQYGQDYAVRHKKSELMSFPFSSVAKRIEDKEHDFIHGVYHVLRHQIENGDWKQRTNDERDGGDNQ